MNHPELNQHSERSNASQAQRRLPQNDGIPKRTATLYVYVALNFTLGQIMMYVGVKLWTNHWHNQFPAS